MRVAILIYHAILIMLVVAFVSRMMLFIVVGIFPRKLHDKDSVVALAVIGVVVDGCCFFSVRCQACAEAVVVEGDGSRLPPITEVSGLIPKYLPRESVRHLKSIC